MSKNEKTLMICGIDTLYYYAQTNDNYENFFEDMMDQVYLQQALFERDTYANKNSAIFVKIGDTSFHYLNKKDGYHWLKEINEYFRIGFKDTASNIHQHCIQVQLEGVGIYTLGIKPLLSFINNTVLLKVTTGLYPITRVDINCFVHYDFSFMDKTMFASKKKNYRSIADFGNAKRTQTIYVGKKPFMLRIYNKRAELKKSKKKEIMEEYFITHGFDMEKDIFNIEFEMHRQHLKAFGILEVEQVLTNASMLFNRAMDDIRMIDTFNITQRDIENNSKNRAKTLPIWDEIKQNFNIATFLQNTTPLQRLPQKRYPYDMPKFINEAHELLNKARTHKLDISTQLMSEITECALENDAPKERIIKEEESPKPSDRVGVYIKDLEGNLTKKLEIKRDKSIIECVIPWNHMHTQQIEKEILRLEGEIFFGKEEEQKFFEQQLKLANDVLKQRAEGLQ
ncbi:MAG: hypothetical protein KA253_01985 [Campylobacteraceae bacterium]|nr:hypothetical protein [Campylobacteraceae bacterium]